MEETLVGPPSRVNECVHDLWIALWTRRLYTPLAGGWPVDDGADPVHSKRTPVVVVALAW